MLVSMSTRTRYTQRDPKIIRIMSFEGSRENPPGMTIPVIGLLIGSVTTALLTTIGFH